DGEKGERERRNGGEQRVAAGDELRLAHFHGGEDGGGEVCRRLGVRQRGEPGGERRVDGQLRAALLASVAVLTRGEALGPAQRAVGKRLELIVGEVIHERCSDSCAFSSLRARCNQVMTVPIGTPSACAIST